MAVRQGYGKLAGTDALVFGYDMGDMLNSFKGKPTTNLLTQIAYSYGEQNSDLFKTHYGYEEVYIPALGKKNAHFCEIYNDYNGGSGNCCLSLFNFGNFSVSPSTTYTYQIIYKTTTGYANGNYMYHYEYGPGGYVTEYGLWSSGREEDLGDGWKHAWGTFTTNANTSSFYTYLFHYEYATFNKVQLAGVMLTQGSEIFRPQQFIPVGNGLTNTGGLLDLTGNSLIDISNVSFDSNAQITFDGTNDYISPGSFNLLAMGASTLEAVIYMENLSSPDNSYSIFGGISNEGYHGYHEIRNSGSGYKMTFWTATDGWRYSNTALSAQTWYHVVWVWNGLNLTFYLNGQNDGSLTFTTFSPYGLGFNRISSFPNERYMNGRIPSAKIYNRALTASEVVQNYHHYKSRYNI